MSRLKTGEGSGFHSWMTPANRPLASGNPQVGEMKASNFQKLNSLEFANSLDDLAVWLGLLNCWFAACL